MAVVGVSMTKVKRLGTTASSFLRRWLHEDSGALVYIVLVQNYSYLSNPLEFKVTKV